MEKNNLFNPLSIAKLQKKQFETNEPESYKEFAQMVNEQQGS